MGFNYQKLKKKYEKLYNDTIEENKDILIESFVEYYGEQHRDEIISRFNEIVFVYFINWNNFFNHSFSRLKNFYCENKQAISESEQEMFQDFQDFFKYRSKANDVIKECFVGSSNKKVLKKALFDNVFRNSLIKVLNDKTPTYFDHFKKNKMQRIICLPIFIFSKATIIHELNHALTDIPLIALHNDIYKKSGFETIEEERIINELINESIALGILKIFERRGGDLSTLILAYNKSIYEKNLYLIKKFYKEFKKIIKESYITLNKNNLVQSVGKENYKELVNMVNKYYSKDGALIKQTKKKAKIVKKDIVENMRKRIENIEELKKEDLKIFYKQLEQEGKKVTILNELEEEKEENNNSLHF